MAGKQVALLFDKPSLRTRVSFEVGIRRLGGDTTSLNATDVGLGSREPIADIARTLSRYVDAIVVRLHSHAQLIELAAAADVPVVNALTEREHPCQALADLLTICEHLGGFAGRRLAYIGDGNNVCHSLLLAGAAVGLDVSVACPSGYEPASSIVDEARHLARASGSDIHIGHDAAAAIDGADAVYTDVWASMGFEQEAAERARAFALFRVSADLMAGAPGAIVMHCLPAHRGQEIDASVFHGPASVVFDQAENRMHAQEALLVRPLGRNRLRNVDPRLAGIQRPHRHDWSPAAHSGSLPTTRLAVAGRACDTAAMAALDREIARLEHATADLMALRGQVEAGAPWPLADVWGVEPEASWGPPELLAHAEEYLRYWMGEIERVLAGDGREPVPFGRVASDTVRLGIIGRDRSAPLRELFARIEADAARVAKRLGELSEADAARIPACTRRAAR